MEMFNLITNNFTLLLTVMGILVFLVSVITEVTKNIGILKKIPTDLQVIVLSILLCQVAYFTYTSYFKMEIQWYYISGCFVAAFLVAFLAMYGWGKLTILYNRSKNPGGKL